MPGPASPTQRILVAAAIVLADCVLLIGCGAVGEPLYPALYIPTPVNDLTAVQRGDKIDIRFSIPQRTTEGLAVKQIGSIELRIGPNTSTGFQAEQWASAARRVEVNVPDAPGPIHAVTPAAEFAGKEVVVAVRIGNLKGRMADWSNLVVLPVEQPLPAPAGLRAEPVLEGVRVSWNSPGQGSFRVFRKTPVQQQPAALSVTDKPEFTDTATEYGKAYQYSVQSVHNQVESEIAGPVSITPSDIFPPRVPSGLTASAGLGAVELAWERNTEADFKEYRVYRSDDSGIFTQIAEGLEGPSYSDRKVETGKRYRYRVTAMDQTGNESVPCPQVEIVAP